MSVAEQREAVEKIVKIIKEEVKLNNGVLKATGMKKIFSSYSDVAEEYRKLVFAAMKDQLNRNGITLAERSEK